MHQEGALSCAVTLALMIPYVPYLSFPRKFDSPKGESGGVYLLMRKKAPALRPGLS